jgi:hypothetical protein
MKEIIETLFAAAMGSDVLDKAQKELHRRFIEGELNAELKEDIETLYVKKLNNLLESILDDDNCPIEDKIKAIEQWHDIMINYTNYIKVLHKKTLEGYKNLCEEYRKHHKTKYNVFSPLNSTIIVLDKNDILKNSFNANTNIFYEGNDLDKAVAKLEEITASKFNLCVIDYRKIYKD